jgi:hypothetical protein
LRHLPKNFTVHLQRLPANRFAKAVADDVGAVPPTKAWAASLRTAHDTVRPLLELAPDDLATLRTSAPEGPPPAQRPGIRLNGGVAPELRT